ncbi:bifunctional proline dehydrogenase/L-glutamate gamma-semialdehyde dehydrogenase PutA [Psychromonas sp. KJ10-2]|uniref:bifunctional proline dehydrogenase/L-glutamate gamma-semialdehyde dehydrogenase PutA n=1 Tax=Psychromonas sp. KJ10-2 TaxID=3391822 RepID=UPI0039B64ADA
MSLLTAADVLRKDFMDTELSVLWSYISPLYMVDESEWLRQLLPLATPSEQQLAEINHDATNLIERVRKDKNAVHMIDALLAEYSLDTKEGILLMCLAEALMRIPDKQTADALIKDKLSVADWKAHLKNSSSLFVNASTWGLLLTGKIVNLKKANKKSSAHLVNGLVNKLTEPVIREVMQQAMKIMGHQFVLGRNINEAQSNGKTFTNKGCSYSFDMLGESALTATDAKKYFDAYMLAIESVGSKALNQKDQDNAATVSIKLSALHPRYEVANTQRVLTEMYDTVILLIKKAREVNVGLTIDAEEADRLELSLLLFEKLMAAPETKGWGKLGIVVQAYSKRALPVLAWLAGLAKQQGDIIPLRLVKGAYWDGEIKISQQNGFAAYPVYTRKEATDVSYLACAKFLLSPAIKGLIFPQFASHNAHTVTTITHIAEHQEYEFQRLHGMGDALYHHVMSMFNSHVRIYAPVGNHKDLLPYLVRRLLENGANSSFVHRLVDAKCPITELIEHPVITLTKRKTLHNNLIELPPAIFSDRQNSFSINIDIESEVAPLHKAIESFKGYQWRAGPIVNGIHYTDAQQLDEQESDITVQTITAPYDRSIEVGTVLFSTPQLIENALLNAQQHFLEWDTTAVTERAQCLYNLADLLEKHMPELVALCHHEAGKTIHDCIDEVREAVDFCRYYAQQATDMLAGSEANVSFDNIIQQVTHQGKGVFVCISPWNFPLAIFLGQITAALVMGNTVIAKPAEQTSLIAARAVEFMLEAGFDEQSIHLLTGNGAEIGNALTSDDRIAGVVFTGSTKTAQVINRSLAKRDVMPATFIAETGGQNAMIVDSTALPEQVVRDVIRSAFASAGQRCSALRVLFIQQDIAPRVIELIEGAMNELSVGLPYLHSTDVGPVIDKTAKDKLTSHINNMTEQHKLLAQVSLSDACQKGDFIAPTAIEIDSLDQLSEEQFGPILHVIRYKASQLEEVINQINGSGYGLTMGIHSRNESTYTHIAKASRVGNCYINRDQVGAVVGVQPFGGQGLSGTGPKAGGPRYLQRFSKQVVTVDVEMSEGV